MDHLATLILGIGNGAVFAALALAIVLTFRSSGVINFATGAQALYGAYTYVALRQGDLFVPIPGLPPLVDLGGPLPLVPAMVLAVAINALLGAVLYLVVFRPLRNAPPLGQAMASLGVMVVITELMAIRVGTSAVVATPIFPVERWELGSLFVMSDRLFLALAILGMAMVLAAVFKFTRFGLLTRAAADSQEGAYLSGISPDRIALLNWMISSAVAGLAGLLIAPLSPLTPLGYTLFVVPALAAAVVGGFRNLVPTFVAGIGIGMLQSEAATEALKRSWMPQTGASELVPLIVILVALLVTSQAIPSRGGLRKLPLGKAPRPRSVLAPAVVGTGVGVLALVVTEGAWRAAVIGTFIAAIIGLSLVVVTGYAGQVSLAQLTMAGSGAFVLSFLTTSWNVPFPLAPLLAALVTAVLGVVVGLPALRLRGLTLAVVTLGFAFAIEAVWFRNTQIVSPTGGKVTQPELFGWDLSVGTGKAFPRLSFGLLCLFVLVAVAVGVALLRTRPLGSAMLAVRANERSAAGLGVHVVRVKVISFALASFIAGLGGALLAYRQSIVTFDSYTAFGNLTLLSTGYLAGITSVWGGVLAGILGGNGVVFEALDSWVDFGKWFAVAGAVALIVTVIKNPEGLALGGHRLANRLPSLALRRRQVPPKPSPAATPPNRGDGAGALTVSDLSLRYGAVLAVDGVSLEVQGGQVVGLIGPNGAGKTSLIDGITGFARAEGDVVVDGESVVGLPPHARLRRGLARTFQSLELYDDLSVHENVSVAAFSAGVPDPAGAVGLALARVGIAELRDRTAGDLSQGQRQLVSIARAVSTDPRVLLLDEPAAGLDNAESRWLGERIRTIADDGIGVLLIDHDISLVLAVCDYIYVLDFGSCIAEGTPAQIRADRAVADAYLGSIDGDAARPESGPVDGVRS